MTERPTSRSSGILLHPTSLPGPFGIGDLGTAAHAWIDTLARARQSWWQILPLVPTGAGNSPYQGFSAFAGNPDLISPELLVRDGLIRPDESAGISLPEGRVDYTAASSFKAGMLRRAWERFTADGRRQLRDDFETFCGVHGAWLDDYALFTALKEARGGESWAAWPRELLRRDGPSPALQSARQELGNEIGRHQFVQFLLFRQWHALREYARSRGIRLIGDVPIFVSFDSADVWANPRLFLLDASLRPRVVAGVPPDYFSPTGQLWGNPLYDWDALRQTGYAWWVARLRGAFELADVVRLDHFRGFCAAWHVPAEEPTAVRGRWVPGPGGDLFERLQEALGGLPFIAEDLGEITPDVYELRDRFRLPGMKVLQFAFDKPTNPFLPHNYPQSCVAYTGTHDNDTSRGWYSTLPDHQRWFVGRYLGKGAQDVAWDLMRLAWSSVADTVVAPAQDALDLGTEARMNTPGRPEGNWRWRLLPGQFNDHVVGRLADLTEVYGRAPAK
jgi:4-alpha-glucanotransferase